jgi:hypothetical protein
MFTGGRMKKFISILICLAFLFTAGIVQAKQKCIAPEGAMALTLLPDRSGRVVAFVSFEDQEIIILEVKEGYGVFRLKGFINDCPTHGREPVTWDQAGFIEMNQLKDCVPYQE